MSDPSILELITSAGLTLSISPEGNIEIIGDQDKIDIWIEAIRENKSAILAELDSRVESHDATPLSELENNGFSSIVSNSEHINNGLEDEGNGSSVLPIDSKYSVTVTDASTDPVLVEITILGLASFTMEIPQAHYDGIALLEVLEQYSTDTALNISGDTYPLPQAKECSTELPDEPQRKAA